MLLQVLGSRRWTWLVWASVFLLMPVVHGLEYGSCDSSGTLYSCPNCGGILVDDCLDCDGYLSTDTKHNICFDRKLFSKQNNDVNDHDDHYHYLLVDLIGAIVWFVMAGVATACGVGGGGIYVPMGILLLQLNPKQSSGLSQASIFGASLGGLLLNARNKHPVETIRNEPGTPDPDHERTLLQTSRDDTNESYQGTLYTRPLINYDMALFLAPMEMAGAVLGVLVQKILPNWLYLLLAGIVLAITSYKTYQKFFSTRQKERAAEQEHARQQEKDEGDASNHDNDSVVENESKEEEEVEAAETITAAPDDNTTAVATEESVEQPHAGKDEASRLRQQYLEEDMRQLPASKVVALLFLWVGLLLLTLFKGGKGVESLVGITCESPVFGVLIACQFLWMFCFAIYFGRVLVKKQRERVAVDYPYLPDDPVWDFRSLRFYGSFTFVAGIVAGLIGIGGGMVLGPLMLIMGIHPRVSSATTATMVVLTSSSVAVIFVTSGLVPWSYAVFYFFVCFSGALVGKSKIDGYVKRTGRASLLIFILASIILFATIGCLVIMLLRLSDKDWCFDGFNDFCKIEHEEDCDATRRLHAVSPDFMRVYS